MPFNSNSKNNINNPKTLKYTKYYLYILVVIMISSCATNKDSTHQQNHSYTPDDPELYRTIIAMDSVFFTAYNNCNLDKQAVIYADNIEFYHDKGGLMTSKKDILDATKKYICGKVSRELVKGSVEVYLIKDFGAIEIGLHKFHNNQEPAGTASKESKFIMMWQFKNNEWKITKVISLH